VRTIQNGSYVSTASLPIPPLPRASLRKRFQHVLARVRVLELRELRRRLYGAMLGVSPQKHGKDWMCMHASAWRVAPLSLARIDNLKLLTEPSGNSTLPMLQR
jgi:hypothetical protein